MRRSSSEAIEYEVSRGGQVFLIHNRVQNIMEIKEIVDRLIPGISSVVAHGQMEGKKAGIGHARLYAGRL